MKRIWRLHDHVSSSGKREVREDYDRLSDEIQGEFDAQWDLLKVRTRDQWRRPDADRLNPETKNGFREFFEIRFFSGKKQQRPLGYFGPDPGVFTLLIYATEQSGRFKPQDAVATCGKRRQAILQGTASTSPWDEDELDDYEDEVSKIAQAPIPKRLR